MGKQCRANLERGIWSGSTLFANNMQKFLMKKEKEKENKNTPDTP